jgi:tRNA (cytidine/uridine-2'-O-)-methyltransferase
MAQGRDSQTPADEAQRGPVWDKGGVRLRARAHPTPFHVVLVEPEIPPNTGNAARLCAATGCRLHLVHPLGFSTDDKAVRRAGLDYWHLVDIVEHPNLEALEHTRAGAGRRYLFTGKAQKSFLDVRFELGDYLVFGRESVGLPESLTDAFPDECIGIPTLGPVRSLNLANAVALGVYEALRQTGLLSQAELR